MLQYSPEEVINNKSYSEKAMEEYPDPVDVVYTWVNGSDAKLISQLNLYKRAVYLDRDLHLDGLKHRLACPYPICGFNNHVILFPLPVYIKERQDFLHKISLQVTEMLNISTMVQIQFITNIKKSQMSRRTGMILHISVDIASLFLNQSDITLMIEGYSSTKFVLSQVYIAAEASNTCLALEGYAFIHGLQEMKDINMESNWRHAIAKRTSMNITLIKASSTSFLVLVPQNVSYENFNLVISNQSTGDALHTSRAFLVVDTGIAIVLSDLSESRYQDNEELRYSLRSLESFLGFYRHIFLVTNGQIPSWLDTNNPRITVVSHWQIFANKSHLPTFNSASIEANLQNIPGLASNFIYLNDDVFFGKPVYKEDFYSLTNGYKVYLGWSVPDCVERCPNSWLADGFCDHECNVPECQWDGGDCIKTHGKVGSQDMVSMINHSFAHMQQMAAMSFTSTGTCGRGCNHNWLGDRYCDSSCNVRTCGFDLGDCGDVHLLSLPSSTLTKVSGEKFAVVNGTTSYVLNLQSLVSKDDHVINASIDDVKEVVASSYAVKYRLLILLLRSGEISDHIVNVNVTVYNGSSLRYNIISHLILNVENVTNVTYSMHTNDNVSETFPTEVPHIISRDYMSPKTVLFYTPAYNSNISIEVLEWKRPLDMSHYRLLLQDGLISLAGYHHLIQQLWISYKMTNSRAISLTAFQKDLRLEDLSWGFLPWERNWQTRLMSRTMCNISSGDRVSTIRHTLDLYADSLRHSNRLLSNIFGISQRRVPAHGPHFLSTSILKSAHQKFHKQWTETSSHRFRSPLDVQFSFSYFYYMMSQKRNLSVVDTLYKVDTDKSGNLDENELRSLLLILSNNDTISDLVMTNFLQQIRNACICSPSVKGEVLVHIRELSSCLNFTDHRADSVINLYQYIIMDDTELAFIMISPNRDKVLHDLDVLRKRPKKFFCLNDNLPANSDLETIKKVRKDLDAFLNYMFPFPSRFEKSSRSSYLSSNNALFWLRVATCLMLLAVMRTFMMKISRMICCFLRSIWKFMFKNVSGSLNQESPLCHL